MQRFRIGIFAKQKNSVETLLNAYEYPYSASNASGEGLTLCLAFVSERISDENRCKMISECIFINNLYGSIEYLKKVRSDHDNLMSTDAVCSFEYDCIINMAENILFVHYCALYNFARNNVIENFK